MMYIYIYEYNQGAPWQRLQTISHPMWHNNHRYENQSPLLISGTNDPRKRQEMRLIHRLVTLYPSSINERLSFI